MPLLFLIPQRRQSNLDLTDQATLLSVAFSVTNYRYSSLLPLTADRASDRVLSEYGLANTLPLITLNDTTLVLPINYELMYWTVSMSGSGSTFSLAADVLATVSVPVMGCAGDYSLATDVLAEQPGATMSAASDYSLATDVLAKQPVLTMAVSGSTYPADRDTVDPYLSSKVVLLVPADGAVTDLIGHNLVVNGNTTISATQSVFGGSALYFDGTGDYLTAANSNDWAFGTGDLTMECWIYPTAYANQPCVIDTRSSGAGAGLCLLINSSGYPTLIAWNSWFLTGAVKVTLNAWQHIAVVRIKGVFVLYLNGSGIGTVTAAGALTDKSLTVGGVIDYRGASASYKFSGYMDAIRITKGVGRYLEHFTPPAVMYPLPAVVQSLYPYVSDPYAANVVLALDLDGKTFLDRKGHTLTVAGDAVLSTQKAKFGSYSGYFDGTGDYLTAANNVDWSMGTGNYTLDAWVYPTQSGVEMTLFDTRLGAAGAGIWYGIQSTGKLATWGFNGAWTGASSTNSVTYNAWNHIAFVRNGTNFYVFLNGVLEITFTGVGANSTDTGLTLAGPIDARTNDATRKFIGFLDSVRITKGVARWSANFVPPTCRYNQTDAYAGKLGLHLPMEGTSGSTAFWEVTGKIVTATGVTISAEASRKGSTSGEFASGGSLTVPDSADLELAGQDFTIEFWVKTVSGTAYCTILERPSASSFSAGSWALMCNANGGANGFIQIWNADYSTGAPFMTGATPVTDDQWHHVAWTRSGSLHSIWVDGLLDTSITWAGSFTNLTTPGFRAGNSQNFGRQFVGYLDDVKVSVGVARYYAPFSPDLDDPFWNYSSVHLPLATDTSEVHGRTITTSGSVTSGQTSVARIYDAGATLLNSGLVQTAADTSMEPGSGDFTVEFWFYTGSGARQWFFAASSDFWMGIDYNSVGANLLGFWLSSNGTSWDIAGSDAGGNGRGAVAAALNKWNHVALVRKGTSITMFVNGVADKTITVTAGTSIINKSAQQKRIGNHGSVNYPVLGHMQDFRFTKGYARYGANFVPADSPMPTTDSIDKNFNNVVTLLNMSSDLTDMKNNTYTNTGITFAEDDVFGRAAVFNGSASFTSNNNINWAEATDATFEAWVYAASWSTWSSDWGAGAIPSLMFSGTAGTRNVYWAFGPTADGKITFYYWSGATNFCKSVNTLSLNAWHHIALVKQGTTLRLYLDGLLENTVTYSAAPATSNLLFTGGNVNGAGLTGRVRNLRVTQGYARYVNKFNPAKALPARLS